MSEWISVKEKEPPKDGSPFLCYDPIQIDNFPEALIYVVHYQKATSYRDECYLEAGGEGWFTWKPTHWMPLPKLPND